MNKLLSVLVLLLLGVSTAPAQTTVRLGDGDIDARMVPRVSLRDADFAMVSRSGEVAMLLHEDAMLLQLTDRGMDRLTRDIDRDLDREEGVMAALVGGVVRTSLNAVFRRAFEFPVDEVEDVRYRDGRLQLLTRDGDVLFEDFTINDRDVMADFSAHDARGFIAEFRRIKQRRTR